VGDRVTAFWLLDWWRRNVLWLKMAHLLHFWRCLTMISSTS
jgi:hypothetical protein